MLWVRISHVTSAQRPSECVRLVTSDGITLTGRHFPAPGRDLVIVLAHGFTGSIQKPGTGRIIGRLRRYGGVLGVDFRGHGGSAGLCTAGDLEVRDLVAAVAEARRLGYRRVATVGFSMGGSIVIRHAALHGGVDAVVSVSGPARWYERSTVAMRRVHWLNETALGRRFCRQLLHTRLDGRWPTVPPSPLEVVDRISPTPLLIVHGDRDAYFPVEHPRALAAAAGPDAELWLLPGLGHAESAMSPRLVDRIGGWVVERSLAPADTMGR
jgi:pimeloyl-ACP methyl ester carboxylesterase